MPNRILRDWTDSEKVNSLSVYAERLLSRLIMKADDYGCYHANPKLLKPNLFPLLIDNIREADISRWIDECEKAGLIVLYEVESKSLLQIVDFGQRLRIKKSKFPLPPGQTEENQSDDSENDGHMSDTCQSDGGHMSDKRPSSDGVKRSRREVEKKRSSNSSSAASTKISASIDLNPVKAKFYDELIPYVTTYGKEMIRAFFDYWTEPSKSKTRIRKDMEKTWDVEKRLRRWSDNQKQFGNKSEEPPKTTLVV
jgi:hypothetical protein